MIRRPPRSTRTDTLFPSTTLFRSLDDGEVICESAAICRYFEALQPDPPLFGRSPVEIARIESWTRRIENDGYTAVVYAFRNSRDAFKGRAASGIWPPIPQIPEQIGRAHV